MATLTPAKSSITALLVTQAVATATVVRSSAVDVLTKFGAQITVAMGRTVATALTNEVLFKLQGTVAATNDDQWIDVMPWTSSLGKTACNATTINDAAVAASDTTFIVTSATGITGGNTIYLRETGTPANSEFVDVDSVSGTTITCQALTRGHTNGITVSTLSEKWSFYVDCRALSRIRLVVDTQKNASGQTVDVEAWYSLLNNITVA